MVEQARFIDYFDLQGGKPLISQDSNGLWHIVHAYREDSPEIVTHISPTERGTVQIGNKIFEVASLWNFEGKPCESQSLQNGGEGYSRR